MANTMSQDDLVAKLLAYGLKLTKAALSKYELNKSTPPPSLLIKLARIFGVRSVYFTLESNISIEWIAFRAHSRLTEKVKDEVKSYAIDIAEKYAYLDEALYPNRKPNFPARRKVNNLDDAEETANALRQRWGLGRAPIESMTHVIEENGGILVFYDKHDGNKFDGLSGLVNRKYPLMVVNVKMPDDRVRYDMAHELGHLLMDGNNLTPEKEENCAHRFAASFLVPKESALKELGQKRNNISSEELGLLKGQYGMSMAAWMRRAKDCQIISESKYKTMNIIMSRKGWKKTEPFKYSGDETPLHLKQMFLRALSEKIITPDEADKIFTGIPVSEQGRAAVAETNQAAYKPSEFLKLPKNERNKLMAEAAEMAFNDYDKNINLTDFSTHIKDDIYEYRH
jgi:Zn-dependent peptidase ImmA (M78 family)